MAATISLGALEITFLQSRETTGSSLDLFEMREAGKCLCILSPAALGPGYFRDIAALMRSGAPDLTKDEGDDVALRPSACSAGLTGCRVPAPPLRTATSLRSCLCRRARFAHSRESGW